MTLVQLKYFTAVCDHGSVSAAAQSLFLSQPSLSAAIGELEEEFGVPLFHRHRRGMVLTAAGVRLYEQARQLLGQAEQTRRTMTELGRGRMVLRLGVPPMIGSLLLPLLYRDFLTQHPQLSVTVTEGGRRELLDRLNGDLLDMVFLPHDRPLSPGLDRLPVTEFETVCCLRKGHPLSARTRLCPEDLAYTPLVLFQDSFFQTERIRDWFAAAGMEPHIILQTQQLSTLQSVVSSTDGACFLFRPLLDGQAQLIPIPLSDPFRVQVSLAWKQGFARTPATQLLREYLTSTPLLLNT